MKFISLNNNYAKYGFPESFEHDDPNFNGHQIGLAVCACNSENGKIVDIYAFKDKPEDERMALCREILNDDKNTILVKTSVSTPNPYTGTIDNIDIWHMPYQAEHHSVTFPTVTFRTVDNYVNTIHDLRIEILFVLPYHDGACRYLTLPFKSRNASILSTINSFFEIDIDNHPDIFPYLEETDEYAEGYGLDFYDPAGQKIIATFKDGEELKDCVNSVRLVGITTTIDESR